MDKEYLKTAKLITSYLKSRFISSRQDKTDQELRVWADQLEKSVNAGQLTQENIKGACDLYAEINGNGFPPTVDQFVRCLNKVSYVPATKNTNSDSVNYMVLWDQADDKAKFRFFIDHNYLHAAPVVRWLFHEYNTKYRGWSKKESIKMMEYHRPPFTGAGQGAMVNHRREVINYFINRGLEA